MSASEAQRREAGADVREWAPCSKVAETLPMHDAGKAVRAAREG